MEYISKGEQKRMEKAAQLLFEKNKELDPNNASGFSFGSYWFGPPQLRGNSTILGSHADPRLYHELDAFIKEWNKYQSEVLLMKQGLFMLLKDVRSPQDVRDALPNSMRGILDQTKTLERTRPEAYTLVEGTPHHMKYIQAKDMMEYYIMSQVLY